MSRSTLTRTRSSAERFFDLFVMVKIFPLRSSGKKVGKVLMSFSHTVYDRMCVALRLDCEKCESEWLSENCSKWWRKIMRKFMIERIWSSYNSMLTRKNLEKFFTAPHRTNKDSDVAKWEWLIFIFQEKEQERHREWQKKSRLGWVSTFSQSLPSTTFLKQF